MSSNDIVSRRTMDLSNEELTPCSQTVKGKKRYDLYVPAQMAALASRKSDDSTGVDETPQARSKLGGEPEIREWDTNDRGAKLNIDLFRHAETETPHDPKSSFRTADMQTVSFTNQSKFSLRSQTRMTLYLPERISLLTFTTSQSSAVASNST